MGDNGNKWAPANPRNPSQGPGDGGDTRAHWPCTEPFWRAGHRQQLAMRHGVSLHTPLLASPRATRSGASAAGGGEHKLEPGSRIARFIANIPLAKYLIADSFFSWQLPPPGCGYFWRGWRYFASGRSTCFIRGCTASQLKISPGFAKITVGGLRFSKCREDASWPAAALIKQLRGGGKRSEQRNQTCARAAWAEGPGPHRGPSCCHPCVLCTP